MDNLKKREKIIDYITRHVFGPRNGQNEIIVQKPYKYYLSGVVFPLIGEDVDDFASDDIDGKCEESDLVAAEQVSTLSGKIRPSSMGIEFRVKKMTHVEVRIDFGTYAAHQNSWKRTPHSFKIKLPLNKTVLNYDLIGMPGGIVRVIQKTIDGINRYRIFVVNLNKSDLRKIETTSVIFQPVINVRTVEGFFEPFPEHRLNTIHPEDRLMNIQYRKHIIHAASYGCAADRIIDSAGNCVELNTTYLPEHEISPLTFKTDGDDGILSLNKLSYGLLNDPELIIGELLQFVNSYREWILHQPEMNSDLDPESRGVKSILSRCEEVVSRMTEGIHILKDESIRESFALANLVMLMQFAHRKQDVIPSLDYDFRNDYKNINFYKWRPFQLAFLLISIHPAVNRDSEYRKICDLIWFPTGGGKTEAYLGLASFTILHGRRLNKDRAGGTMVLSRYTLRLLTSQQFERTASVICSIEMIRRKHEDIYGNVPVSLGLWVGQSSTPNRNESAIEKLNELLNADEPEKVNPFKLSHCPCCNRPLLPDRRSDDSLNYGFSLNNGELIIHCTDSTCPFNEQIPVRITDEDIYNHLPTMIIGTIDKFARLAWVKNAGKILTGNKGQFLSPCLIIQDELHLIAGPLGTIAGVYETAIEKLCSFNGPKPHLVSSTATVRRANEQCLALYGREVRQFPPSGLDEADSFFCKKDDGANGRKYVGILAPHESDITVSVRLHALALEASHEIEKNSDAYSTLVSYFNSLKEMGIANTMAADDIPDWLKVIQPDHKKRRPLKYSDFEDLHGQKRIEDLDDIMQRLKLENDKPGFLSFVLTTNIISVGVDVDRLSLMLVNGQPKTTSEYIQATSRVGRSIETPGLILVKYGAMKPRDRSHYENFFPYHSKIYYHVEPTSVTPFSKPSRDRALHAICIIMMRHLPGGLPDDSDAGRINDVEDLTEEIKNTIIDRIRIIAEDELKKTEEELVNIFSNWKKWADENPQRLYYEARNLRQFESILHRNIDPDFNSMGWNTMDSMRSIDYETRFQIKGEPYD